MKVRALKKFETIKDLERDVYPKEGEVWEVSAERAGLLLKHDVVELVKENLPKVTLEKIVESAKDDKEFVEPIKSNKKKKTSKK